MSVKKNSILMLSDKVIKILITFIMSIFITRRLGSENVGKLSYILSFLGFLEVISIFGMDSTIIKMSQLKSKIEQNEILTTTMFFRIGIYFLTLPVWYIIFYEMGSNKELLTLFLILSLDKLFNSLLVFKIFFQIHGLNKNEVISSQISYFIIVMFKIVFLVFNFNLYVYALILILEKLIFGILLAKYYSKYNTLKLKFKITLLKEILLKSLPLFMASISIFLYMKIDQIMIGRILGMSELGVYSIGVKLSEMIYFVPVTIATAYLPEILNLKNKEKTEKYFEKFIEVGRKNVLLCMIFSSGAILFGEKFIDIIYGEAFIQASSIFRIYSFASIFVALGVSTSKYLILEDRNDLYFYTTLSGAIFNFILNLVVIKKFGIEGAAWTTVISQLISTYLFYFLVKDKLHLKMRTKIFYIYPELKSLYFKILLKS